MNTCPLASDCTAWHRYQRNELLRKMHDALIFEHGRYQLMLWLLERAAAGGEPPAGYEAAYLCALELMRLKTPHPGTESGLCKIISSRVNSG